MNKVTKPTLLLNKRTAQKNIQRMSKKAQQSGVIYRPHFKTHFSKEIALWYKEAGIDKITVSSIDMAVYFAGQDWTDITIAFPVNVLQIDVLSYLAKQAQLNLVVESLDTLQYINEHLTDSVNVLIKIDTGYHRTGIWHEEDSKVKQIVESISSPHQFGGLLAHFGHTYQETDLQKIKEIYDYGVKSLKVLQEKLGVDNCPISIGDTPSCSVIDKFEGVDEVRPGNLVFYDVMQTQIGSCSYEDVAVCLATPIVAIHEDRSELVVHGGAVHLSKDRLEEDGKSIYGKVVELGDKEWSKPLDGFVVKSLSQEHGIISVPDGKISKFKIGDVIGILPIHSCLSANLMREYTLLRGDKISTMHS